jgi:hypothetical protein
MKLYKVSVEVSTYVLAKDPKEAEHVAKRNIGNEIECADYYPEEVKPGHIVNPEFEDGFPYEPMYCLEEDRTVKEWVDKINGSA